MLNSLKFRISATLIVLLALSGGAAGYVFLALDQQRSNNEVVALAGRLQLTAQFLSNQAMRYKEHAPRDYTTYHRDLELYYQDLLGHVETFDMIADAFMHQDFQPMVTGLVDTLRPRLGSKVMAAATDLETAWYAYRAGLFEQLGPDPAAPRLEWGAEFVLDHNAALEAATERLVNSLKSWARNDLQRVRNLILGATGLGLSVSVAVLL